MSSCSSFEGDGSQSFPERNTLGGDNIGHEGNILTPFTYQCRISKLQYLKMYLITVTILPFRVLVFLLLFAFTLLMSNIVSIGYDVKSHTKPICDFRRWLLLPIIRMSARFVFFIGGFHWIKFQGVRASRKEAPILVIAPHSSFLDALVVVVLGLPSIVGKTESAESFVGGFLRMLQPILVNREDPNSRKTAIRELIRRAKSEDDWPQIVIFPEGTCTNRSCIAKFKSGAFNAGVPVQPVIVRWPNKVDSVTWVCEGPGVLKLLWLVMSQFNNRLEVEFLPVYQPNEDEQLDAELYANNVRRIMAERLNVPLCDLSYDDYCQMRIAFKYKIPAYEAAVYLNSLLQMMYTLEHNCDPITDEDKQTEWFQTRLESMLDVCQSKPYLSRAEFIQTIFQTSSLNAKANYLIDLVMKYYYNPSSNNLNFRMCMVHASMLLFPKLPHRAFYYASKAYSPCISKTRVNMKTVWEISRSDAAELLSFAFTLDNDQIVQLILDYAYQMQDSASSNDSSCGISGEYLYEGLLYYLPDVAKCYAHFDDEVSKVFGRLRRPLVDSPSASESNLNDLTSIQAVPGADTFSATSCPHIPTIQNKKAQILTNHFECIDIAEIPPRETSNYSEKLMDNVHLTNSLHKDDQSINFRGRYSERGILYNMKRNKQSSNITPMDVEERSDGKDVFLEKCISFAEITSTDRALGMMYLQKYNWDLELAVNQYFLTQQNSSTSENRKRKRTYQQSNEQTVVIDLTNSDDSCNNSLTDQTISTTTPESMENLPIFNVLSWNIQGLESANLNKRVISVVETIKKEEFHVVCLQEVILVCLEILREMLGSTYHIFSASDHNSQWQYFVVILVKKHPNIKVNSDSISIQPFPNSIMDRHLLSVDLNLSQFLPQSSLELNLRIFTAHLESCAEYSDERVAQLRSVWDTMSNYVKCEDAKAGLKRDRASIFCGDLNLRDSEVNVLGGLPYGVHDVWNECGRRTEIRNTWDPMHNPNARLQFRGTPRAHMTFRYDRMYVLGSRLKPVDFGLRGIEKVKNLSCLPSDHWAILGRFLLNAL
ncbi:unnamed protein product [Schistosoma turkestanicum]|nr:unnamed protein product [Schistosoma turkestanicum]